MQKLIHKIRNWLPITGILLLFILLTRLDYSILLLNTKHFNYTLLTLSIIPLLLSHALLIVKWQLANLSFGYQLQPLLALKSHLVGLFYGVLSPANAGSVMKGELVYRQASIRKSKIMAITTLDKIVDVISMISLATLGLWWWLWFLPTPIVTTLLFIIGLIATISLYFLSFSNHVKKVVFRFLKLVLPKKIQSSVEIAVKDKQFSHRKRYIIATFIVGNLALFVSYIFAYMVALGLGIQITSSVAISSMSLVAVLGLLPISVSGLGTREWGLVLFWQTQQVIPELTVATSLLVFLFHKGLPSLLGAIIAYKAKNN